jgi:hypothetical protein
MTLKTFTAKQGTRFQFNEDLTGRVYIVLSGQRANSTAVEIGRGNIVAAVSIDVPVDDLIEFACHIAKDYSAVLAGREVQGFLKGLFR